MLEGGDAARFEEMLKNIAHKPLPILDNPRLGAILSGGNTALSCQWALEWVLIHDAVRRAQPLISSMVLEVAAREGGHVHGILVHTLQMDIPLR